MRPYRLACALLVLSASACPSTAEEYYQSKEKQILAAQQRVEVALKAPSPQDCTLPAVALRLVDEETGNTDFANEKLTRGWIGSRFEFDTAVGHFLEATTMGSQWYLGRSKEEAASLRRILDRMERVRYLIVFARRQKSRAWNMTGNMTSNMVLVATLYDLAEGKELCRREGASGVEERLQKSAEQLATEEFKVAVPPGYWQTLKHDIKPRPPPGPPQVGEE